MTTGARLGFLPPKILMRRNLKRNPIQGYKIQKSSHDFSFQHSICNIVRLLNFLALERVPPTKALKHREKEWRQDLLGQHFSNHSEKNIQ